MDVPTRLWSFLAAHRARYQVFAHRHSRCSAETARTAQVPAHRLAKGVVVEDDDGRCLAAFVPALAMAWDVETAVDDELTAVDGADAVFVECGDHERLLQLSRDQFGALMRDAHHGRFSAERVH